MSHVTCHMSRAICHRSHVTCHMSHAEFLKGATVQPHGRAKFFGDRARFGFLNAKMHNLPLFYLFGSFSKKIVFFWRILIAQNFQTEMLIAEKKIAFRKSGYMSNFICNFFFSFSFFYKLMKLIGWGSVINGAYPVYFLLRRHQHDTHEAWVQKVCKDRPHLDLVKTGFLFWEQSIFKLGGIVCRKELHLAKKQPE